MKQEMSKSRRMPAALYILSGMPAIPDFGCCRQRLPRSLFLAALLSILVLISGQSQAAKLTAVKAAPEVQYAGEMVLVTVEGEGFCENGVGVVYGDGDIDKKTSWFPITFKPHIYKVPKTYKIYAATNKEDAECEFDAVSTSVEIIATPGDLVKQLCEVTDCSKPMNPELAKFEAGKTLNKEIVKGINPTIDSVFFAAAPGGGITGEPAVLTPAGTIYVKGTGLYDKAIRLKGNFLGGENELQLLTFYEADGTKAHAKIPTDLKADGRIEVTLQVGNSNEFQRQFEVPFEIMRLTGGFKWRGYGLTDIVKVVSCGSQPSLDCVIGDLATYLDYGDVKSPFTIRAVHDCPLCVYSNKGVDRYSISLPESWPCVIYDANSGWYGSSKDESVLLSPENSALGQTEWSPEAVWVVSPGDIARYAINVWIKCQI